MPHRRKRRSVRVRNGLRLGALLVALTGINVYVFFFREDTALRKVLQPSSTAKLLVEEKARVARALATSGAPSILPPVQTEGGRVVEGKVGPSEALVTILAREGLPAPTAANVAKALSEALDPRLLRAGDGYLLGFDPEGNAVRLEIVSSPVLRYVVTRADGEAWQVQKKEKALEVRTAEAAGAIESSLYESVHKAGESAVLVGLLVDLFAWDINFYVDSHPGDHWKVVVEKQFLDGQFYRYGRVVAAEYGGRVGTHRAFLHEPVPGRGQGRYFDAQGQAVAKAFLKSPLRYVRVSSKFDRKRFHPILHRVKAHLGVDYAAPVGTPVWASAGGRVVEAGRKPGSGITVVIAHGGNLATRYYHLSRMARGLVVGRHVKQKEVIGYVGTTGLSTGPHLHFSVTKGGAFVDPFKLQVAREAPVPNRAAYLDAIKPLLAALSSLPRVVARQ